MHRLQIMMVAACFTCICCKKSQKPNTGQAATAATITIQNKTVINRGYPPEFYIDENKCPGEYCEFGPWKAIEPVTLFLDKSKKSKQVANLVTNEIVTAITGDVHTIPGIFLLEKPFEHLEKRHVHPSGEKLYIYTYGSEGWFKFWCEGAMVDGFRPDTNEKFSNGRWLREVDSTWWIKIKTKTGIVGWTDSSESFVGKTHEDKVYEHLADPWPTPDKESR